MLAIPILDTTLVTVRRTLERRPVTQGGTDHSSHRLVYYGLSEQQAVAALTLLAALLGATALAYNVLANARVTAIGLLISFVVLVQFASFLGDLQERSRREDPGPAPPLWRAFLSNPRRLVEVLVDFAIVCVSFLAAYLLFVDGGGTYTQRGIFLATLPILLGVRYVLFVLFGIYRRIWRFASARDLLAIGAAVLLSTPLTIGIVRATRPLTDFPLEIFVVDALLCMTLVAASRLALPPAARARQRAHAAEARARRRRRPLRTRARPRAGRDAGDAGRRLRRRQPRLAAAPDPWGHGARQPRRRRAAARRAEGRRGARDDPRRTFRPPRAARRRLHRGGSRLPLRRPRDRAAAVSGPRARRVTPTPSRRTSGSPAGPPAGCSASPTSCLASLFAWQASQRVSPSIFSDEIEFAQISRGIAETGRPSRLGEPSGFGSLYTYLVAPAWWLDPTAAWEAAKLIGALVMTATLFPAYGLARFVVSRPWAIAAAVGSVAAPPLAYAPYLLEEPLAYPFSTTALWAITAAIARPTRGGSRSRRRSASSRRSCGASWRCCWRSSAPGSSSCSGEAMASGAGARPGAQATGSEPACSRSASRSSSVPSRATSPTRGTSPPASRSSASSTTASGRSRR